MAIQFKGAAPGDDGAAGVVASFMLATTKGDTEGAMAHLTEKSRDDGQLHEDPMEQAVVTFGEVTREGELHIVSTRTAEGDEVDEMDFVVVEETGELRLDMNATMARAVGIDPDEMLEQVAEGMGEAMGQAMSGIAETVQTAAGSIDAVPGRTWTLPGDGFPPEEILTIAAAAATFLDLEFDPELDQLDTEKWGDDDTKTVTTRYGTEDQGYAVLQSRTEQESFMSVTFTAAAYGIPGGRQLMVTWSKSQVPDMEPQLNVNLMMRAPKTSLDALGEMLSEDGEVLHVMDC